MTVRVGLGISEEDSAFAAGRAAAQEACAALGTVEPRLAVVLATPQHDQAQLLEGIRSLTRTAPLIGGSSPWLLTSRGLYARGAAVLLLGADEIACLVAHSPLSETGHGDVAALAAALAGAADARALLMLAHYRTSPSSAWLRAVHRVAGRQIPLAGGVLSMDPRHPKAVLYHHANVSDAGAVVALLRGAIRIGVGAAHGWRPIGAPRRTTRTEGCVVHTINGAPAAGLYRDYFGEAAVQQAAGETLPRMTVTYPLGVSRGARALRPLLRSVERIHEDGSLACLGEVPQEAWVRLMIASRRSVVDAAAHAAALAISRLRQTRCALVLESTARHRLLGRHAAEEVPALQRVLGLHVPFIGGVTQAEIVPSYRSARHVDVELHNETISVIAVGE